MDQQVDGRNAKDDPKDKPDVELCLAGVLYIAAVVWLIHLGSDEGLQIAWPRRDGQPLLIGDFTHGCRYLG